MIGVYCKNTEEVKTAIEPIKERIRFSVEDAIASSEAKLNVGYLAPLLTEMICEESLELIKGCIEESIKGYFNQKLKMTARSRACRPLELAKKMNLYPEDIAKGARFNFAYGIQNATFAHAENASEQNPQNPR